MRIRPRSASYLQVVRLAGLAVVAVWLAQPASAQTKPESSSAAIGEKYHFEIAGALWNPTVGGKISSDEFGIIGSDIDLMTDLGYQQTRFKDLRVVLRPAKKHRLRFQYTPASYTASTTFRRNIVFNGILYPVSVPVTSEFNWNVMRFGYEYDFLYKSRGFAGVLVEGRYTTFDASLKSPIANEFTTARAPLPAIGFVGRAYPLPYLAVNFDLSMFNLDALNLPKSLVKDTTATYYDLDVNGTINFTNNVGMQVGWRKMTTTLGLSTDHGNLKFQGLWFGAALRY
jgi:hypothetical protein